MEQLGTATALAQKSGTAEARRGVRKAPLKVSCGHAGLADMQSEILDAEALHTAVWQVKPI
jgi:hypothetical protein